MERGVVSLFGVKSALFVAMNSKGKLYATVSPSGQGKLQAAQGLPVCSVAQLCLPGSSVHGILQAGVGCHFLLQGIFPIRGSNPRLLHWQVDSLPLSHPGSPCMRHEECAIEENSANS